MKTRFLTLWSINGPLVQTRLRLQLEEFRRLGFDGVVWHPRFYPGEPAYLGPEYLAIVSDTILYAKSLGLACWLYDEDGWPSGTVGGQLLKQYPNDGQRWAELVTDEPECFLAEFSQEGHTWYLAERTGEGVDYFSPELTRHFLELTHERYREGLDPEAWEYVEAFFSDEPEFGLGHAFASLSKHGAVPWTPKLPERYLERYGEELLPRIADLFSARENAGETKIKFWELLSDLFNESFTQPINEWCRKHGKLFTAHLKGEEHPLFQVPTNGSCHQFFRNLDLPGIDALEREPGNNFYPRQLSAAARQFGSGRCMAEAFGGAGWGAGPEDLENYLLWLGKHGITDFVMHLSQYRLDSAAIRDWPPSEPLHLTWREVYPEVMKRVRHKLDAHPRPSAGTLLVAPNRGVMANYGPKEFLALNVHNGAGYPDTAAGQINTRFMEGVERLHRAGVNYDIADERTLDQFGTVRDEMLRLGHCTYGRVVVPEGCHLASGTSQMIQPMIWKPGILPVERCAADNPVAQKIVKSVNWQLELQPVNSLLLEPDSGSDGAFCARFEIADILESAELHLAFADEVVLVEVNGEELHIESSYEGSFIHLNGMEVVGGNTVRFRTVRKVERPFVWLKGFFRVQSETPFVAGPNDTIMTDGPFIVHPARDTVESDLVTDGFPFLQTELVIHADIELPESVFSFELEGVEADAVHLSVGEKEFGWSWKRTGKFVFHADLTAGVHSLQLRLIPSSFNGYGPHHYYMGDWHIVSPDQFGGVRNFADAPGSSGSTHVSAWHFRSFSLPDGFLGGCG